MSKSKQNKKVTSIAIKLNSLSVSKMFSKFLLFDIFLIVIIILYWCIDGEVNYYGQFVLDIERVVNFFPIESATYTATWADGKTLIRDASGFLLAVKKISICGLTLQGIFILKEMIFGTSKIRKILKPLDEIAETASRLSNMTFDEDKVQNLEEAISKISPTTSDEKIHTGDSELQGLEQSINNLLDRMREAYRQQARFVSDASHELRTPISVIQGYANMLDRWGKKDEKILDESIVAIKSESENMKNLVEQLLFLARGINGKTQLNCKEFLLNDMINEVFEESKMIDDNHIYEYEKSDDIKVYADEGLLKQTARILIENAAKYTDKNEVIKFKTGINEKGEPYFYVQDSGIGMDEKDISHIFERFFRADTARDRKTGGTGLGLSIAKWIIDKHRGYFGVLSRKGIGTRITVFLSKNN
ncbi:MAG: HAMP domain-containing histidine kinase [Clostridium sp.]|nr:HAMP domain-containing histidine kinase [Clostridium sp.]MCI7441879.1 HAMP domain-containing histidine kinase [Clostridium sp.]